MIEFRKSSRALVLTKENKILFIKRIKIGQEPYYVTPGGGIEENENSLEALKRELLEETGAVAGKYTDLGKLYPSPGYCGEIISMYLAENLSFENQNLDIDEFLDVVRIPLEKAVEMVLNNEIPDSKTQTAILKAHLLKNK